MTDIELIRLALADSLGALNADEEWINVSPYIKATPTPPIVMVMPSEIMYDIANSRGGDELMMVIQAFVVINFDKQAQFRLDKMLNGSGDLSMKAILEADTSLGGLVDDLRVVSCTGYQEYDIPGKGPTLGADWTVQIETSSE